MKSYLLFLCGLIGILTGCEQHSSVDSKSLDRFIHEYQINPLDSVSRFLIIPLSGCDNYIDPLLNHIKSSWQCDIVDESSHLVLSADWPKQLKIMTNFTAETIPQCIVFDSVNVAYFNGLVFNAPVGYEISKVDGGRMIEHTSKEWSKFLENHFKIRMVKIF